MAIRVITLPNADMSAIEAVLETGYPLTKLGATRKDQLVYGFVDIDEGAQLSSSDLLADNNYTLIASLAFRCRACYDSANSEIVDIVVPG
ncbi:hypothetical protein ON010_g6075 [Phytophthora cinnamomi]|nr:hypothetical protein ON010_g6075 [Phytophthora cinnamomi]